MGPQQPGAEEGHGRDQGRCDSYDLATDLYGRRPTGRDRAALRASLRRLYRVEIAFTGYDSIDARSGAFMSMDRLVERIVSDLDTLDGDARKVGALRGTSFRVVLAPRGSPTSFPRVSTRYRGGDF